MSSLKNPNSRTRLIETCRRKLDGERLFVASKFIDPYYFLSFLCAFTSWPVLPPPSLLPPFFRLPPFALFFFFFFSFFEVGSFGRIRSTSLFAQDEKEREREEKSWQKRGGEKGLAWLVEPLQRNKKPPVKEERADLLRKPQATLSTQPCNYNAFAFV